MKWHLWLGHIDNAGLQRLKNITDGLPDKLRATNEICERCVEGKQSKNPHNQERRRSKRPLQLVHSDLIGPIQPTSFDRKRYILTFIDDYTHFTVVYPIEQKSDVVYHVKQYEAMATAHFNLKLSRFRCDNGREYVTKEMKDFFEKKGIQFECTIPYTPQQNGVAERLNRTILEKARCMLLQCHLPKSFWKEAVLAATYLLNRSPTNALKDKTPAEMWYGEKPNLKKLRIFGCLAYLHVPKQLNKGKFDSKTEKCIFLGYAPNGYRLWSLEKQKILVGRDIIFDEFKFPYVRETEITATWEDNSSGPEDDESENNIHQQKENNLENENQFIVENNDDNSQHEEFTNASDNNPTESQIVPDKNVSGRNLTQLPMDPVELPRRSTRQRKKPSYLEDYTVLALNAEAYVEDVPYDYYCIKERTDKNDWYRAVAEELQALEKNKTWTFTKLPPEKRAIDSRWVFRLKRDIDGKPNCYKARLVVKGCAQRKGIDYSEVYAPVARLTTLRVLLSIINKEDLFTAQMDVKNAFLHGQLEEEIYMKIPAGVKGKEGYVCKLNRSLYGLKQAPRVWNFRFDSFVKSIGFSQSSHDRCLYISKNQSKTYLLLYVDDIILAGNNAKELEEIKTKLSAEFSMKDMGELHCFLGIKIDRRKDEIRLSQSTYIRNMLNRFEMQDCKGTQTPMGVKIEAEYDEIGECIVDKKPYRELVGCIMYLMLNTRPDISASINYYSCFQSSATEQQWIGLKRILRYLKQTIDYVLVFQKRESPTLEAYADADWAGSADRKSTTGFVIEVHGNAVCWVTRRQTTVALSSTEAEYVALSCAATEVIWVKNLLNDLLVQCREPITMYEDNQSCIYLLDKWEHKRMKHIDVKYHFVKDLSTKKTIDVKYISSECQKADILTKGLARVKFERFRSLLGIKAAKIEGGC